MTVALATPNVVPSIEVVPLLLAEAPLQQLQVAGLLVKPLVIGIAARFAMLCGSIIILFSPLALGEPIWFLVHLVMSALA